MKHDGYMKFYAAIENVRCILIYIVLMIRPLFGDFMFFISLPRLFLLPAFFTIINNFLAKFKF